ncbi:hypothetical protein [Pseudotenacibaculum haliotis]|uniref:DUF2892 domain-containing protein n=1 Tax=Pseudotenacibaculum haliotis TaxID=1862138 RepID=A0ABW5LQB2_9FLAO
MKNYFKHKLRSKNPAVIVGTILFIIIIVSLLFVLFGYVIMYLWNWLMPAIFGLTTITFWQAIGICLLSKILFGGFAGGDKGSSKEDRCKTKKSGKKSSSDFSKWKHYESFWQEEGEKAYEEYILRQNQPSTDQESPTENDNL